MIFIKTRPRARSYEYNNKGKMMSDNWNCVVIEVFHRKSINLLK